MKCAKCKEQGLKSRVTPSPYSTSTAMGGSGYYDEDGKYHNHDVNWTTRYFRCSNGHCWTEESKGGCRACGTKRKVKVTWEDDKKHGDSLRIVSLGGMIAPSATIVMGRGTGVTSKVNPSVDPGKMARGPVGEKTDGESTD